jgi:hypothetical protein
MFRTHGIMIMIIIIIIIIMFCYLCNFSALVFFGINISMMVP